MIYVISKSTFGDYGVRDIQCNANWDCCPYSDYALIPDNLVDGILATKGYCNITLNSAGTEVKSFTAKTIPSVPEECCGENTVLSVNGVKANSEGELTLTSDKILGNMSETTAALTDASMLVFKYSNPSPETGAVFYKKAPLLADYIDDKLKVGEKIPKLTKLWTNAKPNSTFAGQTLNVTLSGYDFIMIRYKVYYTQSTYVCAFIKTTSNGILETVSQGGKYRGVTITASSNSVTFAGVYNSDDTEGTNDYLVPYEIYGCDLL